MTPEQKARQIVEAWQRNPGIAGEPDLEACIAEAIKDTVDKCMETVKWHIDPSGDRERCLRVLAKLKDGR